MVQITVGVDGMACSMCEAHVSDAIRKAFPVKKVTASHTKGQAVIVAEKRKLLRLTSLKRWNRLATAWSATAARLTKKKKLFGILADCPIRALHHPAEPLPGVLPDFCLSFLSYNSPDDKL